MAHTRRTMLLDENWDLVLTDAGNISMAEGAYATAQNLSNECRLFLRDAYFEMDRGIPHYLIELGARDDPDKSLLRTYMRKACSRIPDLREVTGISFEGLDREVRKLTGVIEFTTEEGEGVTLDI